MSKEFSLSQINLLAPKVTKNSDGKITIPEPQFRKELDAKTLNNELYRKVAIECGKRCIDYRNLTDELQSSEKLCMNRCNGKFMQMRTEIIKKVEFDDKVEMPPVLYG